MHSNLLQCSQSTHTNCFTRNAEASVASPALDLPLPLPVAKLYGLSLFWVQDDNITKTTFSQSPEDQAFKGH